jgi:uncharacterized protein (DUF983 family)
MANEDRSSTRNTCPHCGKPPGLRFWYLLPSGNSRRVLACAACGGTYDLSDASKMASIMGGLLGIGPGIYALGKIVKLGHGSVIYTVAGTAIAAAFFMTGSLLLAWITQRLVPKNPGQLPRR